MQLDELNSARRGEPRGSREDVKVRNAMRGRLTLYSAAERRYCEPLLRGFAARHPQVELDFVFGISTELQERYLQSASGGPVPDLFWSSAMDQQMGLVLGGHAQPHGVRHSLPASAAYRDLAIATTSEPLFTLARDPGKRAGTPAEIAALIAADPERYRGRVTLPDIETNGLGFLAMLRWSLEEPAFDDFLDALSTCAPRTASSAPALVEGVAEGSEFAPHVLGSYALRALADNPALHIAPSAAPSIAVSRVAFIPKEAKNPAAASALLAYMLSPQGQSALDEAGLFPINAARGDPHARSLQPIPLAPIPLDGFEPLLDPATRAALVARWRAAVGRPNNKTGGTTS